MQTISRVLQTTAILVTAALTPFVASAANNDWTNNTGGLWEDATSWSQGSVPDPTDTVRFGGSGAYTVTVGSSAANTVPNSFTNSGVSVGFTGGSSVPTLDFTYTNPITYQINGTLGIGAPSGTATVNWNAPNATNSMTSLLMNWGTIPQTGTQSVLNVQSGTILLNGQFFMGAELGQTSTINISTGGVFRFVSGQNRIGGNGTGLINVNGGTLDWHNNAFLGYSVGSTGRVVMTSGTILSLLPGSHSTIDIGSGGSQSAANGYGQMIISNGNLFCIGFINVASGPRSRGDLQMFGGTVTNYGRPMSVGLGAGTPVPAGSATGTVLLAGGQWNQLGGWRVGAGSNSVGTVTVTSNALVKFKFTNGHLILGSETYGTGNLDMSGGTMLFSEDATGGGFDNGMIIGLAANSVGRFYMNGGRVNMFGFGPGVVIGSNATAQASVILEGGRMEIQRLTVANAGVLSNRTGGVLQFLGGDIVTGPASQLIVDGGTLSYKGYSGLNITGSVSKFNIVSGSGLQLDTSTNVNITGTYTLANTAGSFKELSLTGGGPRWQSDSLSVSSGARIHVTNASNARVASVVTSSGNIEVQNSTVTWEKPVSISGRYISDPSTNTFMSNVTVTASGTLEGGAGDLFDFKKSLIINSTNNLGFKLSLSTVAFSGGGNHTNEVNGGDFGTNSFYSSDNFGYGRLTLGSTTDHVYFASGGFSNGSANNALYAQEVDLLGNTNLVANLHSAFNIYYLLSEHEPFNAYLQDKTYLLDGGGFLMPAIPEPSTMMLLMSASCALLLRRRSSAR